MQNFSFAMARQPVFANLGQRGPTVLLQALGPCSGGAWFHVSHTRLAHWHFGCGSYSPNRRLKRWAAGAGRRRRIFTPSYVRRRVLSTVYPNLHLSLSSLMSGRCGRPNCRSGACDGAFRRSYPDVFEALEPSSLQDLHRWLWRAGKKEPAGSIPPASFAWAPQGALTSRASA